MIAEINVNIIKKRIFLCKLCNSHSHKYTNGNDDQSWVYCKKIFTYTAMRNCLAVWMHLKLFLANASHVSRRLKNAFAMRTLAFLQSSHHSWTITFNLNHQKQKKQKQSPVEGATAGTLFGVHVGFGFTTCVFPASSELVQNCVKKNRENLPLTCMIRLIGGWYDSHTFLIHF